MLHTAQLNQEINNSQNILLICHRGPDADTIGAAGALAFCLTEQKNKAVKIFCVDPFPANLDFLNLKTFWLEAQPDFNRFDLIIFLDCGDLQQTGLAEIFSEITRPTVVIDHHVTNPGFGEINLINATASSTAEIIYDLLLQQKIIFNKKTSTCLLAGLLSDTDYFVNRATTKKSMRISGELLKSGAALKKIIRHTWRKHSPVSLRLWGEILSQLNFHPEYKIVSAVVPQQNDCAPEMMEGLANFLSTLYEAKLIIVFRQYQPDLIKCSLRTIRDSINVGELAQHFGGGGHAKAAGFSLVGNLEQTGMKWEIK